MRMKENVVVLSLGQMVSSNVDASVAEFARILDSKGVNFTEFRTELALKSDMAENIPVIGSAFDDGTINQYKKGKLNWDGFYQKLNAQLPGDVGLTKDEFKGAWNKMCEIKPAMVGELQNLAKLQAENGLNIVIASATNEAHLNFISDQFAENGIKFSYDRTCYGLSFEKGTLDNANLAQQALKDNGLEGDNILSLHSGIPAGANGTQIPTNPDKGDSICKNVIGHFEFRDVSVGKPAVDEKDQEHGKFVAAEVERRHATQTSNQCAIF